ncbi:MAG: hypothetical protein NVV73_06880 [Cellvibrionaceae bacterium]|nr:hypothetical protein [Cellvibrionaceae bacterium]
MFEFAWPLIFILLPAPLLVYWLVPALARQEVALRVPFFQQIAACNNSKLRAPAAAGGSWCC